jgi:hypothetical protein
MNRAKERGKRQARPSKLALQTRSPKSIAAARERLAFAQYQLTGVPSVLAD